MCELSNSKREHHHVEDEEFKLAEQRQATYQSPCDIPAPGQKFDGGKVQFCLVPPLAHEAHASVLTFGAQKYAPDNWRKVHNAQTRYLNAAFRHIHSHTKGEVQDPESGLPHLAHAIASLSFVLELNLEAATSADADHLAKAIMANAVDADHLAKSVMAAGSHA